MDGTTDYSYSSSPTKENESPLDSDTKRNSVTVTSPSIAVPSARTTLAWQRRPTSQSSDRPKSRPLSMVAAENSARNSNPATESTIAPDQPMSRDQIAQALASKDPSWFRQTADPSRGSAAFRKNQVEDENTVELPSARTQLPGLARDVFTEPSKENQVPRPGTPATPGKPASPLPLGLAQRLDPPTGDAFGDADTPSANRLSTASTPSRTSPTRTSPTKGLGGFVESAMMKRADSVKRWSVNSPAGLHRADSSRSSISGLDNLQRSSTSKSRPTSMLRERDSAEGKEEGKEDGLSATGESGIQKEGQHKEETKKETPPTSPSKTMDPRRWSPNKNSWLEAALNKPESPKTKPAPATPSQPAWLVELNKAKAQKANATSSTNAPATESTANSALPKKPDAKPDGLVKPSSLIDKPELASFRGSLRKSSPSNDDSQTGSSVDAPTSSKSEYRSSVFKPPVPLPSQKTTDPIDELKSIAGSLRRTKTEKYVPQDEFKESLVKGKLALNVTGGPKKSERVDELKEAILKKKEEFKKAQQEGRGVSVAKEPSSASDNPLPEGIAKRLELQRTGTLRHSRTGSEAVASPTTSTNSNRFSFVSTAPKADTPAPSSEASTQRPGHIRTKSNVGSLAARFNPALASLIARGPPGVAGAAKGPEGSGNSGSADQMEAPSAPGPQLTHLTKNRARGPKRKAPTSVIKAMEQAEAKPQEKAAEPEKPAASAKATISPKPDRFTFPKADPLTAEKPKTGSDVIPLVDSSKKFPKEEPKLGEPVTLVGATPTRTRSKSIHEKIASLTALSQQSSKPAESSNDAQRSWGRSRSQTKVHEQVAALASLGQQNSKPAETNSDLQHTSSVKTRPRSQTKVQEQVAALAALTQSQTQKPAEPSTDTALQRSPTIRSRSHSRSPTKVIEQAAALAALNTTSSSSKSAEPSAEASTPLSPKKLDVKRMSQFFDQQSQMSPKPEPEPVKPKPASPIKDRFPSQSEKPGDAETESRPLFPIRRKSVAGQVLSSQPTEQKLAEDTEAKPQFHIRRKSVAGNVLSSQPTEQKPATVEAEKPVFHIRRKSVAAQSPTGAVSPPKPTVEDAPDVDDPPAKVSRPLPTPPPVISPTLTSPRVASPMRSPGKQPSEVAAMIEAFFGTERPRRKYTVDAAEVLIKRPISIAPVHTESVQFQRLLSDGKRFSPPSHHSRTLFEHEMYLCTHTFANNVGERLTEVYLWVGDGVSNDDINEGNMYAMHHAHKLRANYVTIHQGHETSEFIQALGGVVITRRGDSNRYDSLLPSMLCGRRYMGQIVFDEVDFSPLSLCSGFPYLITQNGKCYLWKGKGSDVEELSCARLVGMDLAVTGELIEVEEGSENEGFWAIFGGATRLPSADHWRLKPSYERYNSRLFVASSVEKQQVCFPHLFSLEVTTDANKTFPDQGNRSLPANRSLPRKHLRPRRLLRALHHRRRSLTAPVRRLPQRS